MGRPLGAYRQCAVSVATQEPASELGDQPGHWSQDSFSPAEPGDEAQPHTPIMTPPEFAISLSPTEVLLRRPCQWPWVHSHNENSSPDPPLLLTVYPVFLLSSPGVSWYPGKPRLGHLCSLPPFISYEPCIQPAWGRGEGISVCNAGTLRGGHLSPQSLLVTSFPQTQPILLPDNSDHDPLLLKTVGGSLWSSLLTTDSAL